MFFKLLLNLKRAMYSHLKRLGVFVPKSSNISYTEGLFKVVSEENLTWPKNETQGCFVQIPTHDIQQVGPYSLPPNKSTTTRFNRAIVTDVGAVQRNETLISDSRTSDV